MHVPRLAGVLLGRFLAAHTAALCVCITRAHVCHDGSQTCITYAKLYYAAIPPTGLFAGLLLRHHMTAKQTGTASHQQTPSLSRMHSLACSPYLCSCADSNADSALQLQGYTAAGQTAYALDSLQWIANYFVQNHHADLAFTGQIGNVGDDHSSWGRPENMTEDRPGFDLTPTAPGDFWPPYFGHFTSFPFSSLLLSFHCKQTQLAMHTQCTLWSVCSVHYGATGTGYATLHNSNVNGKGRPVRT